MFPEMFILNKGNNTRFSSLDLKLFINTRESGSREVYATLAQT